MRRSGCGQGPDGVGEQALARVCCVSRSAHACLPLPPQRLSCGASHQNTSRERDTDSEVDLGDDKVYGMQIQKVQICKSRIQNTVVFASPALSLGVEVRNRIGPDLGLVWCRFVLGLPTDNSVISFRLANRNRTDNNFLFFFIFFPHEPSLFPHEPRFFSPRTEIFPHEPRFFPHEPRFFPHEPRFFFPTKFLEAPGRRRSLSVHYRFGQPKPINWVIVSVGQTEVGPYQ